MGMHQSDRKWKFPPMSCGLLSLQRQSCNVELASMRARLVLFRCCLLSFIKGGGGAKQLGDKPVLYLWISDHGARMGDVGEDSHFLWHALTNKDMGR